jgi:hypothetical protein
VALERMRHESLGVVSRPPTLRRPRIVDNSMRQVKSPAAVVASCRRCARSWKSASEFRDADLIVVTRRSVGLMEKVRWDL